MPTTIVTAAPADRQPIPDTAPRGWQSQIPRYRVVRETRPAEKHRFTLDRPFSQMSDASTWQFGDRLYAANEVIETTEWPCAGTMFPINYSARRVMDFFNSSQKSRLQRSPWLDGRVRLEDGLSGSLPKIVGPKVAPIDRDAWPDL
jgi:hypothetical protein